MCLRPSEEIGWEVYGNHDQFTRLEAGTARVDFGTERDTVEESQQLEGDWAFITAGTWHIVVDVGDGDVKLYTIYSPPEQPEGTVHTTKEEADAAEAHH